MKKIIERCKNRFRDFNIDEFVMSTGKTILFIVATIVSAVISVYFISNLTDENMTIGTITFSSAIIMGTIALLLELAKVYHITMYNTLRELARKKIDQFIKVKDDSIFKMSRMKMSARIYLCGYLFYALLAILAGINFSLSNIQHNTSETSSELDTYLALEKSHDELVILRDSLTSMENNQTNIFLSEWNDVTAEIAWKRQTISSFKAKPDSIQRQIGNWTKLDTKGYEKYVSFIDGFNNKYSSNYTTQNFEKIKKNDFKKLFMDGSVVMIAKLQDEVHNREVSLKSSLDAMNISEYDIERKIIEAKNKKIQESGSLAAFELLGQMMNVDSKYLTISLILILTILVEITIYQTSPRIKITKKLLYNFSKYLPNDFDVTKFMFVIDKELDEYGEYHPTHTIIKKHLTDDVKNDDAKEIKVSDTSLKSEHNTPPVNISFANVKDVNSNKGYESAVIKKASVLKEDDEEKQVEVQTSIIKDDCNSYPIVKEANIDPGHIELKELIIDDNHLKKEDVSENTSAVESCVSLINENKPLLTDTEDSEMTKIIKTTDVLNKDDEEKPIVLQTSIIKDSAKTTPVVMNLNNDSIEKDIIKSQDDLLKTEDVDNHVVKGNISDEVETTNDNNVYGVVAPEVSHIAEESKPKKPRKARAKKKVMDVVTPKVETTNESDEEKSESIADDKKNDEVHVNYEESDEDLIKLSEHDPINSVRPIYKKVMKSPDVSKHIEVSEDEMMDAIFSSSPTKNRKIPISK